MRKPNECIMPSAIVREKDTKSCPVPTRGLKVGDLFEIEDFPKEEESVIGCDEFVGIEEESEVDDSESEIKISETEFVPH
ncbi:hypothetical protein JTB14_012618 [Gonioctena quinquepunctata]|nr:hypothetical protein JTB14_012618 [Gonioctena quinquepunctata]